MGSEAFRMYAYNKTTKITTFTTQKKIAINTN